MLALIDKMEADIPECMFEAETENSLRDYDSRLRMQGLDLSTYFKYTGMSLDTMRAQLRPQAEKQVKIRLALEKIAELEKLTVTEEDINAEYKRIAEAYNMPEEEVRKLVEDKGISEDLLVKAAADFVKKNAVAVAAAPVKKAAAKRTTTAKKTTTKKAEGEEAPAKKTTAKKAAAEGEAAPAKKPAAKKTTTKKAAEAKTEE